MKDIELNLDLDIEAKYLSEKTGYSLEITSSFVYLEDAYCDIIGINIYGNTEDSNDRDSNMILDEESLSEYICKKDSRITEEVFGRLWKAEYDYLIMIGIIEENGGHEDV